MINFSWNLFYIRKSVTFAPNYKYKTMKGVFQQTFGKDLRSVYQETMVECMEGKFGGLGESKLYKEEVRLEAMTDEPCETKVAVVNGDCLEVGKSMLDEGLNPAVLNMANAFRPGGGVINGARAQEECIFRRSNLFMSLYRYDSYHNLIFETMTDDFADFGMIEQGYPMDENFGGIYSGGVTVFKDGNYDRMEDAYQTAFISVAALNISCAVRFRERDFLCDGLLNDEAIRITKNKIRTIYRIGVLHGHDSLVLGAWGCGAFGNPPEQMAQLFMEVLDEDEFKGRYKDIRFAIIEDHNSRGRNFLSFKNVISK